MNTSELIGRIDDALQMATAIPLPADGDVRSTGATEEAGTFFDEVARLVEEVYGEPRQDAGAFVAGEYSAGSVAKGMAVLRDLRKLVQYCGEYGS